MTEYAHKGYKIIKMLNGRWFSDMGYTRTREEMIQKINRSLEMANTLY